MEISIAVTESKDRVHGSEYSNMQAIDVPYRIVSSTMLSTEDWKWALFLLNISTHANVCVHANKTIHLTLINEGSAKWMVYMHIAYMWKFWAQYERTKAGGRFFKIPLKFDFKWRKQNCFFSWRSHASPRRKEYMCGAFSR